jgi:daunorubicin resistance ABC transporter ATP-binding subunit
MTTSTTVADRPAVQAEGLGKRFGAVTALDAVDLRVPVGAVVGLLGPNGAGKTTLVRILATLLRPDRGRARVMGLDIVADAASVRRRIGLSGQFAAVDAYLTARENLHLIGRLSGLRRRAVQARTEELLEVFGLTEVAARRAGGYSGGMRRRLDVAASLVAAPAVLILDEPTTGLDPRGRLGLWHLLRRLTENGTSLLLTTQYLEEADRLADTVVVLDAGRVIAAGTPAQLKNRVGGDLLELQPAPDTDPDTLARALAGLGTGPGTIDADTGRLRLPVADGPGLLPEVATRLAATGLRITDLTLRRPTLDDVFLTLTGHGTRPTPPDTNQTDTNQTDTAHADTARRPA